ncbi:metal ABC transporter substrate-binding protein [Paracoccus jiaweipingae]|uniref:metal ABC transporter substrate-binding protein n=1 Tax=unclassified Paracoccus (in: a-proteobacteria) TaxID=2688777 RepID=UPI0037B1C67E
MLTRRTMLASAALSLILSTTAFAQDKLNVVASFSILGDMVQNVGGDRIALTTLVGPDGDGHVYQPTPADAEAVAKAGLLVINGLEFEGWTPRLIEAAGYQGPVVIAAEGITPLKNAEDDHDDHADHDDHDHGDHDDHAGHDHAGHDHDDHDHADHDDHDHDEHAKDDHDHDDHAADDGHHHHGAYDPHAWQSVANARVYVANIARGLTEADPAGAETYAANAKAYTDKLDALDSQLHAAVDALPQDSRTIVTSHDAFGYFARDYGLKFVAPQGVSTEASASARDVGALITQIRDQQIKAVFVENISDSRLLQQIASETGARIGGTLFSDALSPADGPAATYIDMMRHNMSEISKALAK